MAAAYLLRAMLEIEQGRDIRLFEAFVSFKAKGKKLSHAADVLAMQSVAWGSPDAVGKELGPDELAGPHAAHVQSAFQVFGFDCQVPTVIVAQAEDTSLVNGLLKRVIGLRHMGRCRPCWPGKAVQ